MNAKEIVVEKLLKKIEEENLLPWKMSWFSRHMPYNQKSMTKYKGVNILTLWLLGNQYEDAGYMTYKQALELGAHVKKGEKGYPVLYASSKRVVEENAKGELKERDIWYHKYYTVFNVSQIEGLPEREKVEAKNLEANKIIEALDFVKEYGDPSYSPVRDVVKIPNVSDFTGEAEYYASLFHELIHWTGHETRLKRDIKNSFGNEKYSKEELIAEIGASMLMAECGLWLETEDNNAAYVKAWLDVLKGDRNMIIQAASQAQKAVDYILSFTDGLQAA